MQPQELLENAIAKAGSAYKLALLLDIDQAHISRWRKGTKPMSLEAIADLAAYLETDVGLAVTEALIEQTKGTARGERIRRAVGKTLRAVRGVTAGVLFGLVAAAAGAGSYGNDALSALGLKRRR
ncbi:MAG: helix-turn-helix domain-containing protein [Alphaproteobacteria bacterium]|nr:MAG: helix-turn-helix domain-containing protein [Alphaproteobacteria bacterium]